MKTKLLFAFVLIAAVALVSGCTAETPKVWGYVTAADSAQLELAEEQTGNTSLAVDRVLAPENAWIVVHLDDNGKPGDRVGLLAIEKGESADLTVPLEGVTTEKVIVAVHADRGAEGEYDFNMMEKETSPDRPFFVDGAELAKVVTLK
ncbi:MAG: hypothetical protein Q7U89_05340 [Coriobacteriia bacterium]|nr:hypothetical protein [Coriobacteriia bacterium]